jgi:uncharacterized membrane protein YdjX (TVP38/TMEM64 family)
MSVKLFMLRHRRLLGLLVFLLALLAVAQFSGLRSQLNVAFLQEQLQANPWSGLALFVALFCLGNMAQVPGWIFLAAAVYVFGRVNGGLATYVAANVSCLFTFVTIRLVGGNVAATLKSPFAQRLVAQLHAHPVRNVLLLRSLFQTLPALNYALALSGLRLRHYVLGTLMGLPLPIAVYCLFFDYLITAAHKL